MRTSIDISLLRQEICVDVATGKLYWRVSRRGVSKGAEVGTVWQNGYIRVRFKKRYIYAHRIVWALVHGYWPEMLDHINSDRVDNRPSNLRECCAVENTVHRGKTTKPTTSRYLGVYWNKQKAKWQARAAINRKVAHLGFYAVEEDAAKARDRYVAAHGTGFHILNFAEVA